jgi:hypothetical protein
MNRLRKSTYLIIWLGQNLNPEKFAELIVRECISYIDSRDYHSGSEGIAEHFGVEE